jgi:hypothetical protein
LFTAVKFVLEKDKANNVVMKSKEKEEEEEKEVDVDKDLSKKISNQTATQQQ